MYARSGAPIGHSDLACRTLACAEQKIPAVERVAMTTLPTDTSEIPTRLLQTGAVNADNSASLGSD